jgi:hypothetical protein
VYDAGEFVAAGMKSRTVTTRSWFALAAFALSAILAAGAQDSSPAAGQSSSGQSLGDLARKVRKERGADGVPARDRLDGDDDGPDSGGVWRIRMYGITPYEVSVTLPKSPKWTRAAAEPRPVVIPLPGLEDDSDRIIRVYSAALIYPFIPDASRTFLQGWFARPEYFGRAAHIVLNQHVQIDGLPATVSHFSVTNGSLKYHGVGVVMMPNGSAGFACVYRDQDAVAATSICDAIVESASDQALVNTPPKAYPSPQYNPYPGNNDPPDDPPEGDDPD